MGEELGGRDTRQVIEDHLDRRTVGDLEGDLARNYSPAVVLLSAEGISRGHGGVRRLAAILGSYLPDGRFERSQLLVDDEIALLNWSGGLPDAPSVHDGVDTFVVRQGRIVVQTIHYSSYGASDI